MTSLSRETVKPTDDHDLLFQFDVVGLVQKPQSNKSDGDANFVGNAYKILKQGLGNRIQALRPIRITGHDATANFGFVLNPAHAQRTVDHGPAAQEKKAAAAFRKFWGGKAEMRRFKDGSILESLIWTGPAIFNQIVEHLVAQHLDASITIVADIFEAQLPSRGLMPFQAVMSAYKVLENDLRAMDLPLHLRKLSPASSSLRYSAILPDDIAEVHIQFEGSGRWPDDLAAIQRTKAAFLLKINELLNVQSRVGVDDGEGFLDISYPHAHFRLRIHCEREELLLERRGKEAREALEVYKHDFIHMTRHTQVVQSMCTRQPTLSLTIRLLKKWFHSHLLLMALPEEFIELVCLQLPPPSSLQTGFLRALDFLSNWDWRNTPLLFDYPEGQVRFEAWRKLDPAMNRVVLFAASSDIEVTAGPKVIATRMTTLARAACAALRETHLSLDNDRLFSTPLDHDFVIHLRHEKPQSVYKNLQVNLAVPKQDPTKLLFEELQRLYPDILFFYGHVIAGLWSPSSSKWKIGRGSTIPTESGTAVNKDAILNEMARIGGDMIRSIDVKG